LLAAVKRQEEICKLPRIVCSATKINALLCRLPVSATGWLHQRCLKTGAMRSAHLNPFLEWVASLNTT